MSAIKFLCPSCSQHIECGPEYAGMTVNCPACQTGMVVPGEAAAAPPAVPESACPSCSAPMQPDAVICTACGFNLRTGKKIQLQTVNVAVPKRAALGGMGAGNIIAIVVFVVLAVLLGLAFTSDSMAGVFLISASVFAIIIHIMVVISAFQDGAGTGLLTLFCTPYAIYYVYAKSDNSTLKVLYSIALLMRLAAFGVGMHGE